MGEWSDEIEIELTPHRYLTYFEKRAREEVDEVGELRTICGPDGCYTEGDSSDSIFLQIKHDRYNKHDNLALAIHNCNDNGVLIGFIRKNPKDNQLANKTQIEDYCFENGMLKNVRVLKNSMGYFLSRFSGDTPMYGEVEKILYVDNKVKQHASEIETIEHALKNKDAYSLTNYEVEFLESRLTGAKLEHIGKTGKKLASDSVNAVENIVGGAIDVGIGIFNLFKSKK